MVAADSSVDRGRDGMGYGAGGGQAVSATEWFAVSRIVPYGRGHAVDG
jgi:hypothetical protein